MKTLLVTGAAGGVAARVRPWLREHYHLRLMDLREPLDLAENESVIVGDITEADTVRRAAQGVDGILHLACSYSLDITFEATLDANYRAQLYLLDACREFGISRFIFASSHHTVGHHRIDGFAGDDAPVAPDGFYALSKVFGEAACALYSHRHGIKSLSIRIGNADLKVADGRRQHIWVSGRDMAQLVRIGLEHADIGADVVYGVSRCPAPFFENRRAVELGYVPQDDASDNLSPEFVPRAQMPASSGPDHVGGPYVPKPLVVGVPS
ncbi:NAD-dependent epimerase/dehydratase family protein [Pandoraea fibrosis]|uniref:NAD-dependent epimerase/dehydratase family protein n=1 Tax=Pandoraea fibrosis TaxID=1891094 RepID=A0ABX6HTS7_9BURK|nr:NAD(P)-dependent oxidoreductase [Pandoraea fibrosis]QHE92544.1 NAD-dependent epimerase/dehydratase family protein [Pandoraea fibrosis]QHF13900.1 NAD-dependent epimerase/dehydratase family protein [Pandoraea fibrosis]